MENENITFLLDNYYGMVKESVTEKNELERGLHQNGIETFEQYSERYEAQAMSAANHYLLDCHENVQLIVDEFNKNHQQESIQELNKGAENFMSWIAKARKNAELTLREIFGFSPVFMNNIYTMGLDFLKNNESDKAFKILKFLVTIDPTYEIYWIMYGLSQRFQNHEDEAFKAFEVAAKLDETNPMVHLLLAQSYKSAGKIDEAKQYLEEASIKIANFPNKFGIDELIKTEVRNL
jgi:tetratricopeptide (TPR) repeat protein